MDNVADTLVFVGIYSLRFPGLWKASNSRQADQSTSSGSKSERLCELAGIADQTYQHPRQLVSMKRHALRDSSIGPLSDGRSYGCSKMLLACEDDVAVISVLVHDVPLNLDLIFSLLEGSRPLSGRYRSNEFVVESQDTTLATGTVLRAFADATQVVCDLFRLEWPSKCVADYYPFFTICDSVGKYSKVNRPDHRERELAAIISAEKTHIKSLKPGWAKRHLGPDLSHTRSREFYATEHGSLYIIESSAEAELMEEGERRQIDKRVMERSVAVLTFLEVFRAQVVLLRQLDLSLEEILRFRLRAAGLRDVVRLYVASVQSLTRYENLAVQTTPWRKHAWRYIRGNYLEETFNALTLKLGRIERILDIFDRLKMQTFLVALSVILGVVSIVPNTTWRIGIKASVAFFTTVSFLVIVWYVQDRWWRRRVFPDSRERSLGAE